MDTTRVDLTPKPGFCVKTSALQSAVCRVTGQSFLAPVDKPTNAIAPVPGTIVIPQGMKVFVNIAWDANVPPPPEGSEEAIQRAMAGEEEIDEDAIARGDLWFVPVVVSEPRSDTDKGELPFLQARVFPIRGDTFRPEISLLATTGRFVALRKAFGARPRPQLPLRSERRAPRRALPLDPGLTLPPCSIRPPSSPPLMNMTLTAPHRSR